MTYRCAIDVTVVETRDDTTSLAEFSGDTGEARAIVACPAWQAAGGFRHSGRIAPHKRPVQRRPPRPQRLRLVPRRRPARRPRRRRRRRVEQRLRRHHRAAPRPDTSDRRSPRATSPPGFSTRASIGSSAGCTKRRLACRAFGQGSGNSRNSRSRHASGSARSSTRASSGPQPQIARQGRVGFPALRHQARQQRADAVLEHLAGDQPDARDARRPAPARARRRRSRPPATSGRRSRERTARIAGVRQPAGAASPSSSVSCRGRSLWPRARP